MICMRENEEEAYANTLDVDGYGVLAVFVALAIVASLLLSIDRGQDWNTRSTAGRLDSRAL